MKNPFEVYTSSLKSQNDSLDWEESAADSQIFIKGVYDMERQSPNLAGLWTILVLIFLVFLGRIFYLQIMQGADFRALSESNRIRKQVILAPRGLVYDRRGEVLAKNTASFNLVAIPFDLPKQGFESQLAKLAEAFGFQAAEIKKKLDGISRSSIDPVVIKQDVSLEQSLWFETKANEFIGFSIQKIPIREYLEPQIFSHVLGYTGLLGPEDLQAVSSQQYASFDFIGKAGIEQEYEQFLHGINGENLIEVDASGKLLNLLGENRPVPGSALKLNIDKELQEQLFRALKEKPTTKKAAAIALNPKNGEVLALLSLPGYDINLFAHGISSQDYETLINNPDLPLINRAIAGTYPPGSTVKPMVAAAALEEGVVKETTVINDKGLLVIPNQFDPTISYNFYGWKRSGLGPVTVRSAIALSSDIYFYTVSGGHPSSQIKGLGAEKLAEYYRKFNLGKVTGIDLQGEKTGLVPDPDWKANFYQNNPILSKWYLGDTYHIGIGQGDVLATPLQVALWTAVIANNGIGYKPKILKEIINPQGQVVFKNEPEVLISKFISDKNIKIVQEGMRETVLEGSARALANLPVSAAGKTGTSQFDGSDPTRTHAWFTAYAPFEDPQIVITVLVEAGGEGHAAAVPVVKETLEWWAKNRYGK